MFRRFFFLFGRLHLTAMLWETVVPNWEIVIFCLKEYKRALCDYFINKLSVKSSSVCCYVLSRFFLFLAQIHFFFISFLPFCCFCLQKSRKVHFIRYKRNLCIIKNPSFVNKSTSFLGQFLSAHFQLFLSAN